MEDAYRQAAIEQWAEEGEIEIDNDAVVSLSEDQTDVCGAYVAAWVWVDGPIEEAS